MTTAKRITAKHVAGLLTALALAAPTAAFASTGSHEAQGQAPVAMEQKTATSKAADKKAKDAKNNAAKNTVANKRTVQKAGVTH